MKPRFICCPPCFQMKEFPAAAMHKIGESEKQDGGLFGQSASSSAPSQAASASDDVDLKCKERVCDSETENETEADDFENRAFPQQRFSPAISRQAKSDVTFKPKPIKVMPPGDESPHVRIAGHVHSHFIKTGAVFKDVSSFRPPQSSNASDDVTGLSDERPGSAKSDSAVAGREVTSLAVLGNSDLLRSSSVEASGKSRIRSFHNVTVNPGAKRLVLQSNSEHPIGRSGQLTADGAFVSKMQSAFAKSQPPSSSALPASVVTSSLQSRSASAAPVAIASKPKQEAAATSGAAGAQPLLRLMSNPLQVGVASQANVVNASQLSTVLMAGAPLTPGSIAIVSPNEKQTNASRANGSQTPSAQTQPQVVTLLRQAPNVQQPQFVALNPAASRQPAQIQYILPTVTLQAGGSKVAGLVQMQLPGTQLPAANVQLIQTPTSGLQLVNSMPQLQVLQSGQTGNLQLVQPLPTQAQQLQVLQTTSQTNNGSLNVQYLKQTSQMRGATANNNKDASSSNQASSSNRASLHRAVTSQTSQGDAKTSSNGSASRNNSIKVPLTLSMPMLTKALSASQSEFQLIPKLAR